MVGDADLAAFDESEARKMIAAIYARKSTEQLVADEPTNDLSPAAS